VSDSGRVFTTISCFTGTEFPTLAKMHIEVHVHHFDVLREVGAVDSRKRAFAAFKPGRCCRSFFHFLERRTHAGVVPRVAGTRANETTTSMAHKRCPINNLKTKYRA
jgi:hypothetical protein